MKHSEIWIKIVNDRINKYKKTLITSQEFENDIRWIVKHQCSPLNGLIFEIKCDEPFDDFQIGLEANGDPKRWDEYTIEDNRPINCILKLWWESKPSDYIEIENIMKDLFNNFWKSSDRASPSGLISIKDFKDVIEYSQNKLEEMINSQIVSSVLFCDLDNFKIVNEKLNYDEGDRVIREFASLLERICKDFAIILNNGGDEFVIFCPNASHEEALLLTYEIKNETHKYNFDVGDISIDVSVGIATNYKLEAHETFLDILKLSERALKEEVKAKTKGLSRFIYDEQDIDTSTPIDESLKLAFCLTKSNLFSHSIYNNIWLNTLSMCVAKIIKSRGFSSSIIQNSVDCFLNWANFTYETNVIKTSFGCSQNRDLSPKVSIIDISMAVAHGILGSILLDPNHLEIEDENIKLNIHYSDNLTKTALVLSPDRKCWSSGKTNYFAHEFDLGKIDISNTEGISKESLERCILIKIGHEKLDIPKSLFSEIIIVDDRPTRGGGLPDFWEATIARLIARLSRNPNIELVFVIGMKKNGAQTIKNLEGALEWNPIFIQQKTSMPISDVQNSQSRLINIVKIVDDKNEIIDMLVQLLQSSHSPLPINKVSIINQEQRFLERDLRMDSRALTRVDGCRVRTISEAFPIVLEIARKIRDKENSIIFDQAGRELLELIDFKVHLTKPLYDRIPKFYAEEKESLKNYFKKEFLNDDGLFGKVFNETNQLEEVINHTVQAITHSPKPFETRRSILVIPHLPVPEKELAPLGLVSIRCIPRIAPDRIILDYSYTWRTVEALVGFPYSIYGSVCYSEFLTEKIRSRLPSQLQNKVEVGFVSYIAHSLHIFTDDYGQNIAKKIVDDASI